MVIKKILLSIIMSLLVGITGVAGQEQDFPLILRIDQNFWTWESDTGEFIQLTTHGQVSKPIVSPDGQYIAYTRPAQLTIDAIERVGMMSGILPNDIWVYDISTGDTTNIGQQPANASFFVEGVDNYALLRSYPTWSPDSRQIAWTNLLEPTGDFELVIHTLSSNQQESYPLNIPEQYGIPTPLVVSWDNGIAILTSQLDDAGELWQGVFVYESDGTLRWPIQVKEEQYLRQSFWVRDEYRSQMDDRTYFYVSTGAPDVAYLVDTQVEWSSPFEGELEQYHRFAPTGIIAHYLPSEDGFEADWLIDYPDGEEFLISDTDGQFELLLSPDGETAMLLNYGETGNGSMTLWNRGSLTPITTTGIDGMNIKGATWGPTQWRRSLSDDMRTTTPDLCDGLQPRLVVGEVGEVVTGLGSNNMRHRADTDGFIVGEIPEGGEFRVLTGPTCNDGLAWWYVNYGGVFGWTAEGQGDTYWLEPQ